MAPGAEGFPPLHAVTDGEVAGAAGFAARAREVLKAGGPCLALHLRAPEAHGRVLYELADELLPAARAAGALLLVNDRVDVALAVGADGVQLGARSLRAADARRLLGPDRLVGASVHGVDEAREAVDGGADFLVAGNVYETRTHPGRPGAGPALVASVADLGLPVVAIGGVTPERVAEVKAAGAAGVAAVRGIWSAGKAAEAVRRYLEAWEA